jgi:hypothetical protein
VGGAFTYDKDGRLSGLDFLKALELSSTMAIEFLTAWAMWTRVVCATKAKDRGTKCEAPLDWPMIMLKGRLDRLPSAQEFADAFPVEELVEMQKDLAAKLLRHLNAHNLGYRDALRSECLRKKASNIYGMTKGQKVLTDRHIKGENVPPEEELTYSENKTNQTIAAILSLGNESSARLLLKRRKGGFYVDEIEPRGNKRKRS